jgi:outer membrane lipoprotein SlyB
MNFKQAIIASIILASAGAASAQGWGNPGGTPASPQRQSTGDLSGNGYTGAEMRSANGSAIYGTIEQIASGTDNKSNGNMLGKLGGAVLGGLAGHAMGGGNGKTATTVIGAIGGSLAGDRIEESMHKSKALTLVVRMPNGQLKPFPQDDDGTVFAVGQSVIVTQFGSTVRVIPAAATPAPTPVVLQTPLASPPSTN